VELRSLKHFTHKGSERCETPYLLFVVEIGFQDVRSGYRLAESVLIQSEWLDDASAVWTPDMVRFLEPVVLEEIPPPAALELSQDLDEVVISFLVKNYHHRVWKNPDISLYSTSSETEEEFVERCRESLMSERSERIRSLRELFMHRFFELEQRAQDMLEAEELNEGLRRSLPSIVADVFSEAREDLSRCFVRDDYQVLKLSDLDWKLPVLPDVEDRLLDLRNDLISSYNEISESLEQRAAVVEPYTVSVNRSSVDIVSVGVLWE
jgi:hypothetical protein